MVQTVSEKPSMASRANECLLSAIYHFAVFFMSDGDCVLVFGQLRISCPSTNTPFGKRWSMHRGLGQQKCPLSWRACSFSSRSAHKLIITYSGCWPVSRSASPSAWDSITMERASDCLHLMFNCDGECSSSFSLLTDMQVKSQALEFPSHLTAGTPNHRSTSTMCRPTPIYRTSQESKEVLLRCFTVSRKQNCPNCTRELGSK